MTSLMDLPMELLMCILEFVGGRELRRGKGTARLAVSRAWYAAALPVYLSGLGTTNIQLGEDNINRITQELGHSGLRPLMHKNTRQIDMRLPGHLWLNNTNISEEIVDMFLSGDLAAYWTENRGDECVNERQNHQVQAWNTLENLLIDMGNFEVLETLSIEMERDRHLEAMGVHTGEKMFKPTLLKLLPILPLMQSLALFTLDTFGTDMVDDNHMCDELARIIPRVENVRLRMTHICPKLLKHGTITPGQSKMKTLTIKLGAPEHDLGDAFASLPRDYRPRGLRRRTNADLAESLARRSKAFLTSLAEGQAAGNRTVPQMRMSYAPNDEVCRIIDGATHKEYAITPSGEERAWNDDGTPSWFEFSDAVDGLDAGTFQLRKWRPGQGYGAIGAAQRRLPVNASRTIQGEIGD